MKLFLSQQTLTKIENTEKAESELGIRME